MIRIARSLVYSRNHLRICRIGSIYEKRLSIDAVGEFLLPVEKLILVQMILMVMSDETGMDIRQIQAVKQAVDIGVRIQIQKQRVVYDCLAPRPDVPPSGPSAPLAYLAFAESGRHSLACRSSQISDFHRLSLHTETHCVYSNRIEEVPSPLRLRDAPESFLIISFFRNKCKLLFRKNKIQDLIILTAFY